MTKIFRIKPIEIVGWNELEEYKNKFRNSSVKDKISGTSEIFRVWNCFLKDGFSLTFTNPDYDIMLKQYSPIILFNGLCNFLDVLNESDLSLIRETKFKDLDDVLSEYKERYSGNFNHFAIPKPIRLLKYETNDLVETTQHLGKLENYLNSGWVNHKAKYKSLKDSEEGFYLEHEKVEVLKKIEEFRKFYQFVGDKPKIGSLEWRSYLINLNRKAQRFFEENFGLFAKVDLEYCYDDIQSCIDVIKHYSSEKGKLGPIEFTD